MAGSCRGNKVSKPTLSKLGCRADRFVHQLNMTQATIRAIKSGDSMLKASLLRTENRVILTSGSFEKRSPKRVALIININHGKHISLNLAVSRSSVFSYMPFSREMRRLNIYNKH